MEDATNPQGAQPVDPQQNQPAPAGSTEPAAGAAPAGGQPPAGGSEPAADAADPNAGGVPTPPAAQPAAPAPAAPAPTTPPPAALVQPAAPTPEQPAAPAAPTSPPATPPPAAPSAPAQPAAGGESKNLSGIMEENVDISSLVQNAGNKDEQAAFVSSVTVPPHPNTQFDDKKFVELLAGSISLTVTEKKRIIEAVPQLSQFQIDELMKIFTEEQQKFSELEKKHQSQVAELEKQHADSWQDVEAKAEEEKKQSAEADEQAALRASLGLGGDAPQAANDDQEQPDQQAAA